MALDMDSEIEDLNAMFPEEPDTTDDKRTKDANMQFLTIHNAIEAEHYLRREFPEIKTWMCWSVTQHAENAIPALLGEGCRDSGTLGSWKWQRIPCTYTNLPFWSGSDQGFEVGTGWVGLVRVDGSAGESFHIFSFSTHKQTRSDKEYLVSTGDLQVLLRFAKEVNTFFLSLVGVKRDTDIRIDVIDGPDIFIPLDKDETIFLPEELQKDIETEVLTFFANKDLYKRLDVPHARGLLFTGDPGTGKTMMIRRLIRECGKRFKPDCHMLNISRETERRHFHAFFSRSGENSILIIEDIESVIRETSITRAELLSYLDGLAPRNDGLFIATANNPEMIDPALVHRPSRFDRIWKFPLPDCKLRKAYLLKSLPGLNEALVDSLAEKTSGWTVAYLKELRTSAALKAARDGRDTIADSDIGAVFKLLRAQFKAGQKSLAHRTETPETSVGFCSTNCAEEELVAAACGHKQTAGE